MGLGNVLGRSSGRSSHSASRVSAAGYELRCRAHAIWRLVLVWCHGFQTAKLPVLDRARGCRESQDLMVLKGYDRSCSKNIHNIPHTLHSISSFVRQTVVHPKASFAGADLREVQLQGKQLPSQCFAMRKLYGFYRYDLGLSYYLRQSVNNLSLFLDKASTNYHHALLQVIG